MEVGEGEKTSDDRLSSIQELVEQITRQRDVYRTLLAEAGGDLATAAASPGAAAVGILRRSIGAPPPASDVSCTRF